MYVIIVGANNLTKNLVEWYSEYENEITIIEKKIRQMSLF